MKEETSGLCPVGMCNGGFGCVHQKISGEEYKTLKTKLKMTRRYKQMYKNKLEKVDRLVKEIDKIIKENPHSFGL